MATAPMKRRTRLGFADAHDLDALLAAVDHGGETQAGPQRRHMQQSATRTANRSRKPKRDGATHDRIVSRGAQRGTIRTEAELKVENH
jgi:hypothetical protein